MFGKIYEEIDGKLLKEFKSWDLKSKEQYCILLFSLITYLSIQGNLTQTSVFIKNFFKIGEDFSFLLSLFIYLLIYTYIFMIIRLKILLFKQSKKIKILENKEERYTNFYIELYNNLTKEEQELLKILDDRQLKNEIILFRIENKTFQIFNNLVNADKEDIVMLRYFLSIEDYGYSLNKERYKGVIHSEFKGEKRNLKTLEEKIDFIEELWAKYDLKKV